MRRTPALCLFLVVLVFFSGCNTFAGGDNVEITVTPADVPTDEPTPTPIPTLAPGLTKHGVVDPTALTNAHDSVLSNTSYTVLTTTTERYTNGTLRARSTWKARVVEPAGRFYIISDRYFPGIRRANHTYSHFESWSGGERRLIAITRENNTIYSKQSLWDNIWSYFPGKAQLYSIFLAVDTRVVGKETHNGTTLYRIEATEVKQPFALEGGGLTGRYDDPRNITFRAPIDSRGIVHEYRISYTATVTTYTDLSANENVTIPATNTNENVTVRIVRTVRYTKIGSTTVERPPWYKAANQSTTPTPSRSR